MITDGLIEFFGALILGLLGGLFDLIPDPPGWAFTGWDILSDLYAVLATFETWIPVSLAFTVAAAVIVAWSISLALQVTRTIVSYFTLGGGAS